MLMLHIFLIPKPKAIAGHFYRDKRHLFQGYYLGTEHGDLVYVPYGDVLRFDPDRYVSHGVTRPLAEEER